MKERVKNKLFKMALKKVNFYPNLDMEFGGYLQYQEIVVLVEKGVKEVGGNCWYDYSLDKVKNGINGGLWFYFKEGLLKEELKHIKYEKVKR